LKIESEYDMSIQMAANRTMWLGSSNGYIKFIAGTNIDFSNANVNLGSTTATAVFG